MLRVVFRGINSIVIVYMGSLGKVLMVQAV